MFHQADSSSATVGIQAGQGSIRTIEVVQQLNLNTNAQAREADPIQNALIPHTADRPMITQSETQRDRDQRNAITNFLVKSLKQLINNQKAAGVSSFGGSSSIPSSLIQIDLSALGINSFNIAININEQNHTTTPNVGACVTQILPAPEDLQPTPKIATQLAELSPARNAHVTKVYYRKRLKNKTIEPEIQLRQEQVFPDLPEDYALITHDAPIDPLLPGSGNGDESSSKATKKRKLNTRLN